MVDLVDEFGCLEQQLFCVADSIKIVYKRALIYQIASGL